MVRCFWLAVLAVFALPMSAPVLGQDTGVPDTVYFGDHGKAYGYQGGIFRVPVYLAVDQAIGGLSLGIEFGLQPSGIVYDSLSKFGSIFMLGPYFDLIGPFANKYGIDNLGIDTLGLGGVALDNPGPAGRYKFCDVFFHGGNVGEQVIVDSAWFRPAGEFVLVQWPMGEPYQPQFVTENLTIVPAPADMYVTSSLTASGDAGTQIQFDVAAVGAFPPVSIALDSIYEPATDSALYTLPPTFGTNPVTTVWTPTYFQDGIWIAHFTATDSQMNTLPIEVTITVNWVQASCDVLRGDTNCDGVINISDAVYIILYIFLGGPAPGCQ